MALAVLLRPKAFTAVLLQQFQVGPNVPILPNLRHLMTMHTSLTRLSGTPGTSGLFSAVVLLPAAI